MQRIIQKSEIVPLLKSEIRYLDRESRFAQTRNFIQHGNVSVYRHCVRVAYTSCILASILKIPVHPRALMRGALLHDYFLYDWHEKSEAHPIRENSLHGFYHPRRALDNAVQDVELSDREKDIILRHMFPLTVIPPRCREAWLVCLADKICAVRETVRQRAAVGQRLV